MSILQAKKPQRRIPSDFVTRNGTMRLVRSRYEGKKISLEDFLAWEPPTDGRKYEWNQGVIETNEASMTFKETIIAENIIFAFDQTIYRQQRDVLLSEVNIELFGGAKIRRPDIAYISSVQRNEAKIGGKPIPSFVIEIVSTHDKVNGIKEKLRDYFAAGVQVVWYVYPNYEEVEVYTAPGNIAVCKGEMRCSAAPALPEFSMKASDVFA